jgi:hypothetical protein
MRILVNIDYRENYNKIGLRDLVKDLQLNYMDYNDNELQKSVAKLKNLDGEILNKTI